MKIPSAYIITAVCLVSCSMRCFAEESKKVMEIKTIDGTGVVAKPNGGLGLAGKTGSTFEVIDINGGLLGDGDTVKVTYFGSEKPSFWRATDSLVTRYGALGKDGSSVFTLQEKGAGFVILTASGKFLSKPKENGLGLTETVDAALVFKFEPKK